MQELLRERDVSILLGLSIRTLQRLRALGEGPAHVFLGSLESGRGRIGYRPEDVERWLASRTRGHPAASTQRRRGRPPKARAGEGAAP